MELGELIRASGVAAEPRGDATVEIRDLAYDSRRVSDGTLFFCFAGEKTDGHDFAPGAVEAGAAGLIVERPLDLEVPQVQVEDARAAMAPIAATFNGDPTSELTVIGITGTNGKTTTAFLVRHLLEASGRRCGLLGTVRQVVGGEIEEVERTTPEAIDLQRTFNRMLEAGDDACAMEVSSHALVLHRADSIDFAVKVFTNLSQDHLDFHADMEDYFRAKASLFMPPVIGVVNIDDRYGRRLAAEAPVPVTTFSPSARDEADWCAADVRSGADGSTFRLIGPGGIEADVSVGLAGVFNVANAVGALVALVEAGIRLEDAVAGVAACPGVPGRLERVSAAGLGVTAFVDYSHKPGAVEAVLRSLRPVTQGNLIIVLGCGGDRDKAKRPMMGAAAASLADVAILTSDNPRSEDPLAILAAMLGGVLSVPRAQRARVIIEPDRAAAIGQAVALAAPGDVVVVAGKGHETGQYVAGAVLPFDDRQVTAEALERQAKSHDSWTVTR